MSVLSILSLTGLYSVQVSLHEIWWRHENSTVIHGRVRGSENESCPYIHVCMLKYYACNTCLIRNTCYSMSVFNCVHINVLLSSGDFMLCFAENEINNDQTMRNVAMYNYFITVQTKNIHVRRVTRKTNKPLWRILHISWKARYLALGIFYFMQGKSIRLLVEVVHDASLIYTNNRLNVKVICSSTQNLTNTYDNFFKIHAKLSSSF